MPSVRPLNINLILRRRGWSNLRRHRLVFYLLALSKSLHRPYLRKFRSHWWLVLSPRRLPYKHVQVSQQIPAPMRIVLLSPAGIATSPAMYDMTVPLYHRRRVLEDGEVEAILHQTFTKCNRPFRQFNNLFLQQCQLGSTRTCPVHSLVRRMLMSNCHMRTRDATAIMTGQEEQSRTSIFWVSPKNTHPQIPCRC